MARLKSAVPGLSVKHGAKSCIVFFGEGFVEQKKVKIEFDNGTQKCTWDGKVDKKSTTAEYAICEVKATRSEGFQKGKTKGTENVTITVEGMAPVQNVKVDLYDEP